MDQQAAEPKKNRSNAGLLVLVILLLITNVIGWVMYSQKGEELTVSQDQNTALTERNDDVLGMLENTLDSYDSLQTENDTMKQEMELQKQHIEELIAKVKSGSYSLAKARKEAETLRGIMKNYVHQIDSLNQANQALTAQNAGLTQELGEEKAQKEALSTEKEALQGRINKGAILHTPAIMAGGLRVRSNGKQVDTDRAKNAEMVRCCFTVGVNNVTDAGDKTFYLRVISPDGKVLPASDGNNRFSFNGVEGEYSARREVNYQNAATDVCIFWTGGEELRTGQYIAEVYEAGAKVSEAKFDLK